MQLKSKSKFFCTKDCNSYFQTPFWPPIPIASMLLGTTLQTQLPPDMPLHIKKAGKDMYFY